MFCLGKSGLTEGEEGGWWEGEKEWGRGWGERNLILRDLFTEQIFIHLLTMLDAGVHDTDMVE